MIKTGIITWVDSACINNKQNVCAFSNWNGNQGEQPDNNTPLCVKTAIEVGTGCRCGFYKKCLKGQFCKDNQCHAPEPSVDYDFREHICGKNIQILNQGNCGSC